MQDGRSAFSALSGHEYMLLTTYRKSGEAVPTPVWFAQAEDRLYVMTDAEAGKVKRIHNRADVEIAPSDGRGKVLGNAVQGRARILSPDEAAAARSALNAKYGWKKRMFDGMIRLRRAKVVHLEITPLEGDASRV
ncbi:MAG: PPOX class F420-dependent oxidoreductase [Anaerolineae bacterium]